MLLSPKEELERMLLEHKRYLKRNGILDDYKRSRAYQKPSVTKRYKHAQALIRRATDKTRRA